MNANQSSRYKSPTTDDKQTNGFEKVEPLTSTPTTAYNKNLQQQKSGFQLKPLDSMYMKEYSYTVEEHNERNSQFSPKHLGGFSYAGDRQDGEVTPLSSPLDKTGYKPGGYKRATATAFTYKPPEITRTTIASPSTRPLSTYRSAMTTAPTTTTSSTTLNKASTLPSSRLKESTSAYSWSDKQDRVRTEKVEERQFAQLINTKDVEKDGKKEKSASTDKMNALFGSGKSKFGQSGDKATSAQTSKSTKSSIFSSFMKSGSQDEKVEKKKQLSQSTSNVLEQKKTSSTSSLINKYNNLTSSPKVIGSSGQLRQPYSQPEPVKQTKLDSDTESASSSENSMDEYASEDLKTDPTPIGITPSYLSSVANQRSTTGSLPRTTTNNLVGRTPQQRYEPQPTIRTSLTIQPSTLLGSSTLDRAQPTKPTITPKPTIPTKPSQLTNHKVSPYESKFATTTTSSPSPIATRTQTLLNNSYLKDNFLKDKTTSPSLNEPRFGSSAAAPTSKSQVPIKLQTSTVQPTQQSSPSYLSSPKLSSSSSTNQNNTDRMPYSPYNNALVTTTTIPHVQQPKITHLSRKRTVKKPDGSVEEDEEVIEPKSPQTYISTATFTPSKPLIVGARVHSNSNLPDQLASSHSHTNHVNHNVKNLSKLVL